MVSIYIRTFKRDIAWLDFCLQSIHQNLKGWDEIVVCVPEGQAHHLRYLTTERRVTSPFFRVDYVGQQVAKLQAHRQVSGDYIFFVDADVIFLPGADVATFLDGDRPIQFASLPLDPAKPSHGKLRQLSRTAPQPLWNDN